MNIFFTSKQNSDYVLDRSIEFINKKKKEINHYIIYPPLLYNYKISHLTSLLVLRNKIISHFMVMINVVVFSNVNDVT
jgi:hypothetical protein